MIAARNSPAITQVASTVRDVVDGTAGALELVSLGDLLQRLVDRIVDLMAVDARRDVE